MSNAEGTTATPETASPAKVRTVNEILGLRPTTISDDVHPDERPCPTWCWIEAHNPSGYAHEIDPSRIGTARHSLEADLKVRATLFNADRERNGEVATATYEPSLEQYGSNLPFIRVGLRGYKWVQGRGWTLDYRDAAMKLTIEDACDMVTALEYLIDVAKGVIAADVEHEDCPCNL